MIPQYAGQAVVRDSAAQVMNMMHADIGGEPAQNAWLIVRTPTRKASDCALRFHPAGRP